MMSENGNGNHSVSLPLDEQIVDATQNIVKDVIPNGIPLPQSTTNHSSTLINESATHKDQSELSSQSFAVTSKAPNRKSKRKRKRKLTGKLGSSKKSKSQKDRESDDDDELSDSELLTRLAHIDWRTIIELENFDEYLADSYTPEITNPSFIADLTTVLPRPPLVPLSLYPHHFTSIWAQFMTGNSRSISGHQINIHHRHVHAYEVYRAVIEAGGYIYVICNNLWHDVMRSLLQHCHEANPQYSSISPPTLCSRSSATEYRSKYLNCPLHPLHPQAFLCEYYEKYLFDFEYTFHWQSNERPKINRLQSVYKQIIQQHKIPVKSTITTVKPSTSNDRFLKLFAELYPPSLRPLILGTSSDEKDKNDRKDAHSPATVLPFRVTPNKARIIPDSSYRSLPGQSHVAPEILSYSGIRNLTLMLQSDIESEITICLLQLLRLSQYTAYEDEFLVSDSPSPDAFSIAGTPHRTGMDFTIPINIGVDDASDNSLLFVEDLITPLLTLYNEYRFIDNSIEESSFSRLCFILDQNPFTGILQNSQSSLQFPLFARRMVWDIFYNLSKVKSNSQRLCSHPSFLSGIFCIYDGEKTSYCESKLFQLGIEILLNLREHVNLSHIQLSLLRKFVLFFQYYLRNAVSVSFSSLPETEVSETIKLLSYFLEFLMQLLFNDHAKSNCSILEELLNQEFCIDLITLSCQNGMIVSQIAFFISLQCLGAKLFISLIKSSTVLSGDLLSSPEFEMFPRMVLLSVIHTGDLEINAEIRRLRLLEFVAIVNTLAINNSTTTATTNGDTSTPAISQIGSASVPKSFSLQALVPYESYLFALCLNKKEMSHLIAPLLRKLCTLTK